MKSRRSSLLQLPIEGTEHFAHVFYRYLETGGFLCDGITEYEAEHLRRKFKSYLVAAINNDRKATRQEPCAN